MEQGSTSSKGKRKLDPGCGAKQQKTPVKQPRGTVAFISHLKEARIRSDVGKIMEDVRRRIPPESNKALGEFVNSKINKLETNRREMIGVFGRTGAGKSSLINAILGENDLLPTGRFKACTSVIIKVENSGSSKYEGEIEFIKKEEWQAELESFEELKHYRPGGKKCYPDDSASDEEDDDDVDFETKLSALYGDEWKRKKAKNLMEKKYFEEIPEFLCSERRGLTCDSAKDLSAACVKFTNNKKNNGGNNQWYWPLVKCVTIRVPDNDLLQHVTLVDLPGNGDNNRSRDQMWKEVIKSCSTVWIVSEMTRAASDKDAFDILKSASRLMGNGGECQRIHFICTKSDAVEDSDNSDQSAERNRPFMEAKRALIDAFDKNKSLKNYFDKKCLSVFTVSSKEVLRKEEIDPDVNEIPKIKEFLQTLNDYSLRTLTYVSAAHGILSLIEGSRKAFSSDKKTDVLAELHTIISHGLGLMRDAMDNSCKTLEKGLIRGIEESKTSCEKKLRSVIHPNKSGSTFHMTLRSVVKKYGIHKPKNGRQINLNATLSSCLTAHIDEEFKKVFPNDRKQGAFNNAINRFSLGTKRLKEKYRNMELQLRFLRTEEENIKTELEEIILESKKKIYNGPTETIEENMRECYERAAAFTREGSLENMRETLTQHVAKSKDKMFDEAGLKMLEQLKTLKEEILMKMKDTLMESVECSLTADDDSLPDVSEKLERVKKYKDELRGNTDENTTSVG